MGLAKGTLHCIVAFSITGRVVADSLTVSAHGDVASTCGQRVGDAYVLCADQMESFATKGLAILPGVLTEEEVQSIESTYNAYMANGSPAVQGKDFCDMSKPFDTPRAEYSVINAMLPRVYYPELQNNIYERVAQSVADQLFPDVPMVLDYDQLLDKMPGAKDAVFAWHQDMAYWPPAAMTPDTRTVTFSLALDATTIDNGCIKYVPGSGAAKALREHKALASGRAEAHAVRLEVNEAVEGVEYAQVPRGDVSIHDEWVVHGSGGNASPGPRRTYVAAFRPKATVAAERAAGFTHSHNDVVNWDSFNHWSA